MALAAGDCRTIGERWPTEFMAIQREKAVPSSPSKRSSPASATRRSRLFTGVVGPFRAWKLPLGTCTKNRRVTSTIKMKNINLACLALMALSLPFPAIAANEVFALPFSLAARRQSTGDSVQICAFLMVPLHKLKNIGKQSCWKEHNGTVTLAGGHGCFSLLSSSQKRQGKSHLLLVRVFCIYLYKLVYRPRRARVPARRSCPFCSNRIVLFRVRIFPKLARRGQRERLACH